MPKSPSEMLRQSAETFEGRDAIYGSVYKSHGSIMTALLPNPVNLQSVEDHNRFGILNMIVSKLSRYCQNFENGGHDDSLLDLSAYAAMLRSLDQEARLARKMAHQFDQQSIQAVEF